MLLTPLPLQPMHWTPSPGWIWLPPVPHLYTSVSLALTPVGQKSITKMAQLHYTLSLLLVMTWWELGTGARGVGRGRKCCLWLMDEAGCANRWLEPGCKEAFGSRMLSHVNVDVPFYPWAPSMQFCFFFISFWSTMLHYLHPVNHTILKLRTHSIWVVKNPGFGFICCLGHLSLQ